jgi:hypothetical protein
MWPGRVSFQNGSGIDGRLPLFGRQLLAPEMRCGRRKLDVRLSRERLDTGSTARMQAIVGIEKTEQVSRARRTP